MGSGRLDTGGLYPEEAFAGWIAKRSLTNLNNEHPAWLQNAHIRLHEAAFETYGLNPGLPDTEA